MADNMIELVAKLDTAESTKIIQKQLDDTIAPALKLKIKCDIDTNGVGDIQKQLSNLGKNISTPEIKAPVIIDNNEIKKVTDEMVATFNNSFNMVGKMGDMTKKQFNAQTKMMLQELQDAWGKGLKTGNMEAYAKALKNLQQRVEDFSKGDIEKLKDQIKDLQRQFTDGSKVAVESSLVGWVKEAVGDDKLTRKYFEAIYGKDVTYSKGVKSDTLTDEDNAMVDRIIGAAKKILEYKEKLNSVGWGLDELREQGQTDIQILDEVTNKLHEIVGLSKLPDRGDTVELEIDEAFGTETQQDIETVKDKISETTAEASKLNSELKKVEATAEGFEDITPPEFKLPSVGAGYSTKDVLEGAKTSLNEFFATNTSDDGLTRSVTRVTKAVEDAEGNLKSFIVQVERGDKATETLTYSLDKEGKAYEYLSKVIREADNSSDLRKKDLDTQWGVQAEKLKQFTLNADKAGLAGTALKEDIKQLYDALNKANPDRGGDTSTMNAFLDKFDIAKAKLQAFNAEARRDNAAANLSNRIKNLTADMTKFAAANERATTSTKLMSNGKTFAEEWNRLTTEMAKGADLTQRELQDLTADFKVFGKEAAANALMGENAWGKFLNSFKLMSSYITANMVFNFVKRQIREMVDEVVTIDTAMTELRKVTEATNAEFEKFAKSAAQTGKELGASISDVIDATSTFSRLGESLPDATELGRIAILYQNVADGISAENASEDIISTMKAFKIEAKDAIEIVDKFNEVEACPLYVLVERNRGHIFSNCWEILKPFCLSFR